MGYVIHQLPSAFRIRQRHFGDALAAVKMLHHSVSSGLLGGVRAPYVANRSFVDGKRVEGSETLEEALHEWRWLAITDESDGTLDQSDIVEIQFVGEKLGDDDALFASLAPFVDEGSFVAVVGEDGQVWRWFFTGAICVKQNGRLVYDDRGGADGR